MASSPQVLGVDDWALRKGQTYGTILVDLETRKVIDLLPERSADTLATWLQEHPGVKVISRDRGSDYIKGATAGAPNAVQVADRFHLVQNLVDTLKRMFDRHVADLRATADRMAAILLAPKPAERANSATQTSLSATPHEQMAVQGDGSPRDATVTETTASSDQDKSLAELRFDKVKSLQQDGLSQREIARRLSISRSTVSRYVALDAYPERASGHPSASQVLDYLPYLSQRWREGCRNAKQLFAEIEKDGFSGSYSSVWRFVNRHYAVLPPACAVTTRQSRRPWSIPGATDQSRVTSIG